jgi:pimeloyl-ACP methyl ester carboxylesterase
MATFVMIHGAGDVGWYWHLLEEQLRSRGHDTVAPDLPADDESLGLSEYADAVVDVVGRRDQAVVVAQSFGAFTAPLAADRLAADLLVLVAGMVPAPGEAPSDWWSNTGYQAAVEAQATRDGGLTGHEDPLVGFYHDVPRDLAQEALSRGGRRHPSSTAYNQPWPLEEWPRVPTRFVLCSEDRFFPREYLRTVASTRLNVVPDEIAAGHCVALAKPQELANLLQSYLG